VKLNASLGLLSPLAGVLLTLATAVETDLKTFYAEKLQQAGATVLENRLYSLLRFVSSIG